jgi:hypothetical protein
MPRAYAMRRAAFLAGAMLLFATPVQAQFGKLKKLGADAIKDAAKDKLSGTNKKDSTTTSTGARASGATGGTSASSSSTAKKNDFTLTEDRVALVLVSLESQVADAQKRDEAIRATRAYLLSKEALDSCVKLATKRVTPATMAASAQKNSARISAIDDQARAASKRMSAAMEAGDMKTASMLADTVNVLQTRSALLTMGATCKAEFKPAVLAAQENGQQDEEVNGTFNPGATVTELLSVYEYGMLRERIALWALLQENPSVAKGKEGVFTAGELAALTANAAAIKKLTPYFKSDAMIWKTWNDLKSW